MDYFVNAVVFILKIVVLFKAGRELSPNLKTGKSEKNETNSETKQVAHIMQLY